MQQVDAARAADTATAFAPLFKRAQGLDRKISRLEGELDALHGERVAMAAALAWAGGADAHPQTSARAQAEQVLREQQEEAQRNQVARRHGEQAAELAREGAAREQERIVEAETAALARRQAALHG